MKYVLLVVATCIVSCSSHKFPQDRISRVILHETNGTQHSLHNVVGLGRTEEELYVVADSSVYVGAMPQVRIASSLRVTSAVLSADTLFLATPRGLRAIALAHNTPMTIDMPARDATPPISALAVDPRGRIWIGTDGYGLFVREGNRIVGASTTQYVRALACHPDSSVWVGSDMGVLHLKDNTLRHYSEEITSQGIEVKDNIIDMITIDREGTIWIGTSQGMNVVPDDVARHATDSHHEVPSFDYIGRKGNTVHCVLQLEAPKRDWLLGTDDGLFVFDAETVPSDQHHHGDGDAPSHHLSARRISFQTEQTPASVQALSWTSDHGLLIGTTNGLIYMPNQVISTMLDDR